MKIQNNSKCADCKKDVEYVPIGLEFGYGSSLDGETFIFCSDKYFKKWVMRKIK